MYAQPSAPPLPVFDADAERNSGAEEEQNKRCCKIFGGHTVCEAGTSRWASPRLLMMVRTLFALFLLGYAITILVLLPKNASTFIHVAYHTLYAASFAMLAVCTSLRSTKLANVAIPLYYFSASAALLIILCAIIAQINYSASAPATFYVPFLFFLIDSLVLQARVCFPWIYIIFPIIVFTIQAIVSVFSFGATALAWLSILYILVFALLVAIAGALVCAISRINFNKCCGRSKT